MISQSGFGYLKCRNQLIIKIMRTYLNTLLEEKGIDQQTILEVEGMSGINFIPVAIIVDYISKAPLEVQENIKGTIVNIDFRNGNILDFFKYIAEYLAR